MHAKDVVFIAQTILSMTAESGKKSNVSLMSLQTFELPYFLMTSSWKP